MLQSLMGKISESLIKRAFYIGSELAILCFLLACLTAPNILNSIFVNLGTDFFILGLSVSIVNKLLDRYERQRYGDQPAKGLRRIEGELGSLLGTISYELRDHLNVDAYALVDANEAEISLLTSLMQKMYMISYLQLQHVDMTKVTYKNFAEMLRYIQQTLAALDLYIDRYSGLFEPETLSRVIALRDSVESSTRGDITLITIPFEGQSEPDKKLSERDQTGFSRVLSEIIRISETEIEKMKKTGSNSGFKSIKL
ncbi:MAG TPA: hypothetical protein VMT30_05815 [Candidatus Saccharimonadia bacterium]|nr:hypothetical protein [Candidatus Saccharimonadia bacterium]